MRIKINKRLKIGLIVILVAAIGIISFLLYRAINNPEYKDEKVILYKYNNKSTVNYEVFLKPNILYEKLSLGEGQIYISEFVDYIKTNFNYEFSGDKETDIQGNYSIIAKVSGSIKAEEKGDTTIWQKEFVVLPKKKFKTQNKTLEIKEQVSLKLDEYNEFAKSVTEASKINSTVNLNLVMNINLEVSTDEGLIEDTISPSMNIPLNTTMFQISGNMNIDKPGAIEETKQIQLPVNKKQVIIYGVIIGILLLILIILTFFTKEAPTKDPLEKNLKKIFKKHGDRLVALNSDPTLTNVNLNQVKSIDDLVRIADEIGKPILYKYSQDYKKINKFYITHEEQIYIFDIRDIPVKDEVDTIDLSNKSEDEEIKIES